jgi:penicillin amidase
VRRLGRVAGPLLLAALIAACPLAWVVCRVVSASLPPLDGTFAVGGIQAGVTLERDALGVVTVKGTTRPDVAFGLGFAHAQDRLFQMDLLRRYPAGELSALFGPSSVNADRSLRLHRFRWRAERLLAGMDPPDRALLEAYGAGVEAGRRTLGKPPWEYLMLGAAFEPWRPEDSILVGLGMFLQLQRNQPGKESAHTLIHETLPEPLANLLTPAGSSLDAPLLGDPIATPRLPTANEVDLRPEWGRRRGKRPVALADAEPPTPGSNNWAVGGKRTRHGGAILACDMHLHLGVPNIWYRAAMEWGGRRLVGATLPGTPALIIGSNGHVAWGFTNAEVDCTDLVVTDAPAERFTETIHVLGGAPVTVEVEETAEGPVYDRDHKGRRRVLRWVGHRPEAVNLRLMEMEEVKTVRAALALAPRIGMPAQNLVVADDKGSVGWALMGRMPRRVGGKWEGWWDNGPALQDPPDGIVWTANNRVFGEPWLSRLGRGTHDHGARATQIRDGLRMRPLMDEADMLAIQLDDRTLFLARWRELFLAEAARHGNRLEVRDAVVAWRGRAVPESVGVRLVKEFRSTVRDGLLSALCAPCSEADRRFSLSGLSRDVEGSVWEVVTKRPPHLLPPGYRSWDDFFAHSVRAVEGGCRDLARHTLAETQAPSLRHPLSGGLGPVGRWLRLDMDTTPLPGDDGGLPRVQSSVHMASQRMAVSPGREAEGYFHMPTGQSGHFLSPFYRAGHADWAEGRPSPLLPGLTRHTIVLKASGNT